MVQLLFQVLVCQASRHECLHPVCVDIWPLLDSNGRLRWLTGGLEATTELEELDDEEDTDSDEEALLSAFEDVLAGWATAARLPQRLASAVGLHQAWRRHLRTHLSQLRFIQLFAQHDRSPHVGQQLIWLASSRRRQFSHPSHLPCDSPTRPGAEATWPG